MTVFPDRFIQGLRTDNPWWVDGSMQPVPPAFKRSDFKHYVENVNKSRVEVIVGPRRVGKTTLIWQIINHLLDYQGVDPQNILFVSLERPYMELVQQKLESAIDFFENSILHSRIADSEEMIYIFVDEAQYDPTWARVMKQYVDQKRMVHAVVSGSSSTAIYKDSESGAGRFHNYQMVTMKLRDIIRLKHPELNDQIERLSYSLREVFVDSLRKGDWKPYQIAVDDMLRHTKLSDLIAADFEDYILKGGYPEFYDGKNTWKQISAYYQQNVFDLILQKDVVNQFAIRLPEKIRNLFIVLANNTAKILTRKSLCDSLGLTNVRTVDEYVDALSEAFLIRASTKFKASGYPSTKEKKFYIADVGIRNAVLGVDKEQINSEERGRLLETVVFNHSLRFAYHLDNKIRMEGNYWMDKDEERDIIIDFRGTTGHVFPIEVKNGHCGNEDIKKMETTISKLGSNLGMILCEGRIGITGKIILLPSWIFALSC